VMSSPISREASCTRTIKKYNKKLSVVCLRLRTKGPASEAHRFVLAIGFCDTSGLLQMPMAVVVFPRAENVPVRGCKDEILTHNQVSSVRESNHNISAPSMIKRALRYHNGHYKSHDMHAIDVPRRLSLATQNQDA
jgi:hypothetical protein